MKHATLLLCQRYAQHSFLCQGPPRGLHAAGNALAASANRPMPQVTVVDMRKELESGNRCAFSAALLRRGTEAMSSRRRRTGHAADESAAGYNSFVSCRSCGYVVKCPNCDVAMTYHVVGSGQTEAKLHCHYCGFGRAAAEHRARSAAASTSAISARARRRSRKNCRSSSHGENVVRMDIDTTSGKDGHAKLLDEFRSGRAKLLVGTQMIAKGLDFPEGDAGGRDCGGYDAESARLPRAGADIPAADAGRRAGPDAAHCPGRSSIQTLQAGGSRDSGRCRSRTTARFFELEFDRRRTGLYPPFTILCAAAGGKQFAAEGARGRDGASCAVRGAA